MSPVGDWLHDRVPSPPPELVEGLGAEVLTADPEGSTAAALLGAGLARLELARKRPGRVRESAFHLLAADALVTYACEAALEEDDVEAHMLRIMEAVGER